MSRKYNNSVYDPNYVPRPWFFTAVFGCISLLLLIVFAKVVIDKITTNSQIPAQENDIKSSTGNKITENGDNLYKVVKVIDGDTIEIAINSTIVSVRIIGIDTPETVDPRKPVQCFGKEASGRAKELLERNSVKIKHDPSQGDKDKYNRLLRYIYLGNGTDFGKQMIEEGYAHEYTYNIPYTHQAEYKAAEKNAMESGKGLWSSSACGTEASPTSASVNNKLNQEQNNKNCDPNYTPCVPDVSYDLDCSDIRFSVTVIGNDRHRFDKDGDGFGCETN